MRYVGNEASQIVRGKPFPQRGGHQKQMVGLADAEGLAHHILLAQSRPCTTLFTYTNLLLGQRTSLGLG